MKTLARVNVRSGPNGFLKLGMLVSLDLVVVVDAKIAFGARPSAHGFLSCTTLALWMLGGTVAVLDQVSAWTLIIN